MYAVVCASDSGYWYVRIRPITTEAFPNGLALREVFLSFEEAKNYAEKVDRYLEQLICICGFNTVGTES